MQAYYSIDGKNFYYMFLAGAKNLVDNYAYLNKINVYPVPDGDTGTNMASTIQSVVDSVKPVKKLNKTLAFMADAALEGARGNSGIIVAQFLQGMSVEMENYEKINPIDFAQSLSKAVDYTYAALVNPVEGTILSVFRTWSDSINENIATTSNFVELIINSYDKALEALKNTTYQLKSLSKAGVVDAGAQGFIFFLKGMMAFSEYGNLKDLVGTRQSNFIDLKMEDVHEEVDVRYCTEALLKGKDMDLSSIREELTVYGSSVAVAGKKNKVKVHIHTDTPNKVMQLLGEKGQIISSKVDDMVFQNEIIERRRYDTAFLIDSSADIPDDVLWNYQIHLVSLQVQLEKNTYIDRITLKHDEFYDYLKTDKPYPKTSLPSLKDIQNKLMYLASHYKSIIVINVSSGLSGTWQACHDIGKRVSEQTGIPIEVIDTKTLAGAQGLIALRAAQALEKGVSYKDLCRLIPAWSKQSNVYAIPKTLKYFVKGGRISKFKGLVATFFGLFPVVTPNAEGKGSIIFKSRSQQRNVDKIIKHTDRKLQRAKLHSFAVEYTGMETKELAENTARRLEELWGINVAYIERVSPVIGNSAGVGAIAIATMME